MRPVCITLSTLFLLLTGCAKYEYDIVQPAEHAGHIASKMDTSAEIEPITYRLRSVDNRLVLRAYNDTDEPIELLGEKSAVVDPDGQSHPLRSQTIAPTSFIKVIFPPPRPRVYDSGPTFGVGVGYGISSSHYRHHHHHPRFHSHYPLYDPYYPEPRYITVYDDSNAFYWDWRGSGTEARVNLVYRRGDGELRHSFVFRRVKV